MPLMPTIVQVKLKNLILQQKLKDIIIDGLSYIWLELAGKRSVSTHLHLQKFLKLPIFYSNLARTGFTFSKN